MKRAIGMVAISMLVLAACSDSSTGDDAERETTTATDSTSAPADGESVSITILGTSDVHGRYMPWDYTVDVENTGGSLTQIATAVKEIQADEDNTILVDIGDLIQDNASELFQDMDEHPGVAVINELGYDVWTMGNHEFDYGMEKLDNIVEQFDGTVLGGNLYTEAGEQYWDGSTVIERGGVKIGIVGLTTPMVYEFKEETDTFDGLEFKPTIDEAKKAIDELGDVDAVVGVIHMGVENENNVPDTGVADIIAQVPEFDVIFAGHMHDLVNEEIEGVLVVEPDKYATNISRVDLTFSQGEDGWVLEDREGSNIEVETYESDPAIEEILAEGHEMARADANVVIGELTGMPFTPGNTIEGVPQHQIEETPLTVFFNDVMHHYSNGADVVAHQIDNDEAGLPVGEIKKKDLAYNYQYAGGEVTVYEMTGQDLKDYMEWSAGYFNQVREGDVTVSFNEERRNSKYSTHDIFGGISYEFDLTKPEGERVTNLKWPDGTEVDMDEPITVGMNSYRLNQLIAEDGPLEGREFNKIYSTQDESAFGEVDGRIRNLAARYIEELGGTYEGHLNGGWELTGVQETPDYVIELINDGIISIGEAENGRTNIESVNVTDPVTDDLISEIAEKAGVDSAELEGLETTGELYQKVNELRK